MGNLVALSAVVLTELIGLLLHYLQCSSVILVILFWTNVLGLLVPRSLS